MKLIADISPFVILPKTGIAKILEGLIEEFKKKDDIELCYFALSAREHIKKLKYSYPNLKAPYLPARLLLPVQQLMQGINMPIDIFTGSADAVISIAWQCLPLRFGKTIAIIADLTPLSNPDWHKDRNVILFKKRIQSIERNADLVVTISQASKNEIIKKTNIPEKIIIVTYPGLSREFRKKPSKTIINKVTKKYKIPKYFLLFVGTQEPRKNLSNLIEAFKSIDSKIKNKIKLLLVGQKGWGSKMKKYPFVKELGYIPDEDLPAIYLKAQGLVYPSKKEGFGLPIIEAFSMEIPVLTSNVSSMDEIAKGAGILIDPYSVKDIKRGLTELLNLDFKKKEMLIKKGGEKINNYSYSKMAEKIINEIRD